MEINKIETRKTIEKNKCNLELFFKKINKTEKSLARLKKGKIQINKIIS